MLNGRVVLVTGGLRGIGEAVVARLLKDGARVVIGDIASPDGPEVSHHLAALGAGAEYLLLDVADETAWRTAAAHVSDRHGRLDVLVNNAGVDCVGPVNEIALADWRRLMSINLDGVFLGVKHLTELLADTGRTTPAGSSIVNVSSMLAMVGYADTSPYNASKGAVRAFTKATAIEFATKKIPIRVNSVHPGFVRTPMMERGMQRWADQGLAESAEALIAQLDQATPIGRVARASEIAAAIAFFASDDSSYCTGSELAVDGGWTAQ